MPQQTTEFLKSEYQQIFDSMPTYAQDRFIYFLQISEHQHPAPSLHVKWCTRMFLLGFFRAGFHCSQVLH